MGEVEHISGPLERLRSYLGDERHIYRGSHALRKRAASADRDSIAAFIGALMERNAELHKALAAAEERAEAICLGLGATDIALERSRQRAQWGDARDDAHDTTELVEAAVAYALTSRYTNADTAIPHRWWPWDAGDWRPATPRRMLVKAGALIAAEIDRLDRLAATQEPTDDPD